MVHHRNMRAVEIIGTKDYHDIHVLWMATFDRDCIHIVLLICKGHQQSG